MDKTAIIACMGTNGNSGLFTRTGFDQKGKRDLGDAKHWKKPSVKDGQEMPVIGIRPQPAIRRVTGKKIGRKFVALQAFVEMVQEIGRLAKVVTKGQRSCSTNTTECGRR